MTATRDSRTTSIMAVVADVSGTRRRAWSLLALPSFPPAQVVEFRPGRARDAVAGRKQDPLGGEEHLGVDGPAAGAARAAANNREGAAGVLIPDLRPPWVSGPSRRGRGTVPAPAVHVVATAA